MFDDCVNETKMHALLPCTWAKIPMVILSENIAVFLLIDATLPDFHSPSITLLIHLERSSPTPLHRFIDLPIITARRECGTVRVPYIDDYNRRYRT